MRKFKLILVAIFLLLSIGILAACDSYVPYPDDYFADMRLEDNTISQDANIRVMSANVLVHIKGWGGTPVAPRAQMFAESVKHYRPDVVALQEFCGCWYKRLPEQLADYSMLDTKNRDYTTMMYNNKTMRLIDQGILRYSKESNKNCRFVVWGAFERIADGKRVIVTSTHWDLGMEENKVEMRNTQIVELANLIDELASKYNAPVIAVGDFNAQEKTISEAAQSYIDFIAKANVIDSKFADGITARLSKDADYSAESYDHLFIKGEIQPITFGLLDKGYYDIVSDHPLIYLDAKI